MRRLLLVALGFLATALLPPTNMLAQHAAPAGALASPHMGGAVHASPSFPAPPRSFASPAGPLFAGRSGGVGHPGHWPSNGQGNRPGGDHRATYPYFYGNYPGLISFGYGLPVGYGLPYGGEQQDDGGGQAPPPQADYSNQPMSDYDQPPPQVAQVAPSPYRPAYQGPSEFAPVHPQPATTLIFKDGRAPAQVHNYALTGNTLYALDGDTRQEIPLSAIDVPATIEANRQAGVDFALPISH